MNGHGHLACLGDGLFISRTLVVLYQLFQNEFVEGILV
jgi:hypothetical protein